MRELLDQKLARFRGAREAAVGPGRTGQRTANGRGRARARLAGQAGHEVSPLQEAQRADRARPWRWSRAATPTCASWPRPSCPSSEGRAREPLERTARHDHRRRGRQPHALRPGNPRRHRRRRGRPVRPRPLRNVQALRRGPAAGRSRSSTCRPTELGGFKEIILGVEGEGVYRKLQYESGGHRVQRVPETEAKGRIHTSAATVAVMAEPEDVEIDLKPDDYRKDIFRASGPGGQHVNKTASAIRLTHYETGHRRLAARTKRASTRTWPRPCACSRRGSTRHKREAEAQEAGRRAQDARSAPATAASASAPTTFPQNRLTDHRINLTLYKLDSIIAGNLRAGDRRPDGIRAPGAAGAVRNGGMTER